MTRTAALLLALVASAATALDAPLPMAGDGDAGDGHRLGEDVVIAGDGRLAFVTDPRGRVTAIDLDDGRPRWTGPARGRALALHAGSLWVLGHPDGDGRLVVLELDPASGEPLARLADDTLPPEVLASPAAQPASRFRILAVAEGDGLALHWQAERWPLRGALLAPVDGDPDGGDRASSGVHSVDRQGASLALLPARVAEPERRPDLPEAQRLAGDDRPQYLSADGNHVLVAAAVADPDLGWRWRWRILRRADGGEEGALAAHYPMAPFLLRGSTLVWREEPVVLVGADGRAVESGVRLQAADLATGRLLWSFQLADPVHRLPPPP